MARTMLLRKVGFKYMMSKDGSPFIRDPLLYLFQENVEASSTERSLGIGGHPLVPCLLPPAHLRVLQCRSLSFNHKHQLYPKLQQCGDSEEQVSVAKDNNNKYQHTVKYKYTQRNQSQNKDGDDGRLVERQYP